MAKQDDYVRYTIRVPAKLYDRLQESAGEKSVNAEIVARLEDSFEAPEGYRDLAEVALASMKEAADNARRELEEYREMTGMIRLYRHIIDRLLEQSGKDLPKDIATIVSLLNPTEGKDEELLTLVQDIYAAQERREKIIAEQASSPSAMDRAERKRRMEAFVERNPNQRLDK